MAKILFLVRHAEAMEASGGMKDKDRPLTPSGYQDAPRVGQYLFNQQINPDTIISSDAERARITAMLLAEQLKFERHKIVYDEEVYKASVRSLLELICNQKNTFQQVIIVCHNPIVTYLAEYLTHQEIGSIEPCGVVQLQVEEDDWMAFSGGAVDLVSYITPETLRST